MKVPMMKTDKLHSMANQPKGESKGNPRMPKMKQIANPKGESKGNPRKPDLKSMMSKGKKK